MPGFSNGTVYANNVDFTGNAHVQPQINADGQLLIGSTAAPNIKVGSLSAGTNMVVTPGSGTLSVATSATPSFTSVTVTNAPVSTTDATNKAYVDAIAAGFDFKNTTQAGSTGALTATYNNGVGGVGATLTNSGALAAFSLDGVAGTPSMRVLIKDQASSFQNGIYTVTTVGDGATAWVLTRATDYDTTAEMLEGSIVPVQQGTVNTDTLWLQNTIVGTIGVDAISYQKFQSAPHVTTQYAVLVGDIYNKIASLPIGSAGQVLQSSGAGVNPAYSTATYPLTSSQGDLLLSSAANTITTLAKDTNATRYLSNTGASNNAAWAQINLANGVTGTLPSSNGGRITWSVVGASAALVANTGIICTSGAALSFSLPASSAVGDIIEISLDGSTSWTITQGAGQQIRMGSSQTTSGAGGSLASTAQGDTLRMVCSVADTRWNVLSSMGNITIV